MELLLDAGSLIVSIGVLAVMVASYRKDLK
jgi:hypothetical protein